MNMPSHDFRFYFRDKGLKTTRFVSFNEKRVTQIFFINIHECNIKNSDELPTSKAASALTKICGGFVQINKLS